jgi:hypothetical protein
MSLGGTALSAAREVQIPIIAALLVGACAAKVRRAVSAHGPDASLGPTAMFPIQVRKPVTIAMCACEAALGVALLVTAGQAGAGLAATATRCGTVLLLAIAVGALNELRHRRPGVGCGCFGDLSETPVSWRPLTRSALLCAAAIATIGAPPLRLPATPAAAIAALGIGAAELAVIAALSPEVGQFLIRLGYSDPCEARGVPVARSLACLRGSAPWRDYQRYLASPEPTDVWREGCWRFLAYAAVINRRTVDVVFGVSLQARRPAVRAAVVAPLNVNPAGTALPVTVSSDAETLTASAALTAPMPVPRWAPPVTPTFTPVITAGRARPARLHLHPLAHAAPRESAHLQATAPQPALPSPGGTTPRTPRGMPAAKARISGMLQPPRLAHHHHPR